MALNGIMLGVLGLLIAGGLLAVGVMIENWSSSRQTGLTSPTSGSVRGRP